MFSGEIWGQYLRFSRLTETCTGYIAICLLHTILTLIFKNFLSLNIFWGGGGGGVLYQKPELEFWSSSNKLKFGIGVHRYMLIFLLYAYMLFFFSKILSLKCFGANLVPKSEVLQIDQNLVQGYIAMSLFLI